MIVHHYYPQRLNIGDSFVRDGIHKLISACRADVEFVDFPVNRPRRPGRAFGLAGENLDRSNAEADLLVVGGSNLYQCRKSGEWGVATDVESIRKLAKPLMLIGLGSGSSFMRTVRGCSEKSAAEIRLLNEVAVGSSVRDVRAGQFLDALGVTGYTLTGCPATFVFDRPFAFNGSELVVVSFPPERFRRRRLMFFRLMRTLRGYIEYCHGLGLKVALACHDQKDVPLARRLADRGAEVFYSEDTKDYYELYGRCRLGVGFRLHGSIICLSLGIPFIPLYFDMRGIAFARTYGSQQWTIDASRFGLGRILRDRTRDIFEQDRTAFEQFLARKAELRDVMERFVADCLRPVR